MFVYSQIPINHNLQGNLQKILVIGIPKSLTLILVEKMTCRGIEKGQSLQEVRGGGGGQKNLTFKIQSTVVIKMNILIFCYSEIKIMADNNTSPTYVLPSCYKTPPLLTAQKEITAI